jgi:hypothetical protein
VGDEVLIRRVLSVAIATFLAWAFVAIVQAPTATADCSTSVDLSAGDGFASGRVDGHCSEKDHKQSGDRNGSDSSDSSGDECVQVRTVTGMMGCEDDHNGVTRIVTPPSEAEVRVALHLPDPTPRFGPDPSANEWKMLAVGYPIWLWTDPPTHLSATATHDGLTMTLVADWTSTSFDMGDDHTVTCTRTTKYPEHPSRYGTPSPTCGYTYQTRSKPGHDYTVAATTHWDVTWSTAGRSGSLTTTYTGRRTLPVGEIQAVVKG